MVGWTDIDTAPVKDWGFYGRHREATELDAFMDGHSRFDALIVRGRRKVGKSEFVKDFFHRRDNGPPAVIQHLSSVMERDRFLESLKREARAVDPSLLDGFVEDDDTVTGYPRLVAHLLKRGCTVVIDEFQRIAREGKGIDPLYLQYEFQREFDDLGSPRNTTITGKPRLIVMGSEQQKLMEMFKDSRNPLYDQITRWMHLRPWTFDEIVGMAADQGWDARPDRLLTLWTAYGGMPGHWKRFHKDGGHLVDFSPATFRIRSGPTDSWRSRRNIGRHLTDPSTGRWRSS